MKFIKKIVEKFKGRFTKAPVVSPIEFEVSPQPAWVIEDISEQVYAQLPSDIVGVMRRQADSSVLEVFVDPTNQEIVALPINQERVEGTVTTVFTDLLDGQRKSTEEFLGDYQRETRIAFYVGLEADSVDQGLPHLVNFLMEMHEKYGILACLQSPIAFKLASGHQMLLTYVFAVDGRPNPWGPKPVPEYMAQAEAKRLQEDPNTYFNARDPWIFQEGDRPSIYVGMNPVDYSKFMPRITSALQENYPKNYNTFLKILNANPCQQQPLTPPPFGAVEPHSEEWRTKIQTKNDPETQALVNSVRELVKKTVEESKQRS